MDWRGRVVASGLLLLLGVLTASALDKAVLPTGPLGLCAFCCNSPRKIPCPATCYPCQIPVPPACPLIEKLAFCSKGSRDTCRSSRDCKKGRICCNTGCSKNCVRGGPIIKPPPPPPPTPFEKPGVCPYDELGLRIRCPTYSYICDSDIDCRGSRKCCPYGCAQLCVPTCRRKCRKGERCILRTKESSCFVPPCPKEKSSACEVYQPTLLPPTCLGFKCPAKLTCVLKKRRPTCVRRPTPPPRPGVCPINDRVPSINCDPDTPYRCGDDSHCAPDQKCCSFGCSQECVAACPHPCGKHQQCVRDPLFDRVRCHEPTRPCPPLPPPTRSFCQPLSPPPTCATFDCPAGQVCEMQGEQPTCRPSTPVCRPSCPRGQRCQVRGLKNVCTPIAVVTVPGVCPKNDIVTLCAFPENACTRDNDCGEGLKCCRVGCIRVCTIPCPSRCRKGQQCLLDTLWKGPVPRGRCRSPKLLSCANISCSVNQRCVEKPGGPRCQAIATPTCKDLKCGPAGYCILQRSKCGKKKCPVLPVCVGGITA